ncbi:MAG: B12-binding domain-containing radical SAM protein, partial [bacterium]|nr:B12-binding domain-containing radical SAM protein [bacterium]
MGKFDKKNIEDILGLTPMQEGLLFHYLEEPGSAHYFEQLCLEISGHIQKEPFENAWNRVIETNEMMRTLFRWEKVEKPVQIILSSHTLKPVYYDFTGTGPSQSNKHVEQVLIEDRARPFDLTGVPFRVTLCKIEEKKYRMIISNHHILYDGWSNGIILKEFFSAYSCLVRQKSPLRPPKNKYKAFVNQFQNRDSDAYIRQENFWRGYLNGFDTNAELPVKNKKALSTGNRGNGHYQVTLATSPGHRWEQFTQHLKITLACLLYGTWGILVQRYNNREDIVFGTTVSGRSHTVKGIEDIVGLFINTIPLRIKTTIDSPV